MKIRTDDIREEERTLEFREGLGDLNDLLRARAVVDFQFDHEAEVELRHYRAGADILLDGTIATEGSGTCARCLEPFPYPIQRDFRWVLKPRSAAEAEAGADAEGGAGMALSFYEGDEIDVAPLVREEILVTLPTRALCAESCTGLCSRCGTNRNLRECDCREESGDPRLAVLRGWKPSRG